MIIVVYSPTFHPVVDGTSIQSSRLVMALANKETVFGLGYAVNRDIKPDEGLLSIRDGVERFLPDYAPQTGQFPRLSGTAITSRLGEIKPDIVHIRGWYQFDAAREVIKRSRQIGARIYWHGDGLHECHEYHKQNREYGDCISFALSNGVNFVGNSLQDTQIFLSLGAPKERTYQVMPFIQTTYFPNRDWNKPRVLSVGRFFDYKRHDLVINVSQRMCPQPDIVVAGASDTKYFDNFIRTNNSKACIIADPSDSLVKALYDFSTHFLLASEVESLGIVTLEAVKSGCVPLVRKIGGIISYLPDRFLFQSELELESKLRTLLNPIEALSAHTELSPLRDRMSNKNILADLYKIYMGSGVIK